MVAGFGLVLMIHLLMRFFDLTNKPIHFDESVNSWFVDQLRNNFFFRYDPTNYHGPFYFYWVYFIESLFGTSLGVLRFATSLWSFVIPIFVWILSWRQKNLTWLAAMTLMSSSLVFYGRSGIHESSFAFFQIVFLWATSRLWGQTNSKDNHLGLWLFAILMMATIKETFVLLVGPVVLAILLFREPRQKMKMWIQTFRYETSQIQWLALGLVSFIGLFSAWMFNPHGLVDFVNAFLPWAKTGVKGAGHNKSFSYWFELCASAEPTALLAMGTLVAVAVHRSLRSKGSQNELVFWVISGVSPFLFYSLIPYKTPWCLVSLVVPLYFAFAECLKNETRKFQIILGIIVLPFYIYNVKNIFMSCLTNPIQMEHPFVYVQTTYQLKEVEELLVRTMEARPLLRNQAIQVSLSEQWPFPWILRVNQKLVYDLIPNKIITDAWAYLLEPEHEAILRKNMSGSFYRRSFISRQSGHETILLIREEVMQ